MVDDAGIHLPFRFFTLGVEAVAEHWAQGRTRERVLIHCESGAHRSPALALVRWFTWFSGGAGANAD